MWPGHTKSLTCDAEVVKASHVDDRIHRKLIRLYRYHRDNRPSWFFYKTTPFYTTVWTNPLALSRASNRMKIARKLYLLFGNPTAVS